MKFSEYTLIERAEQSVDPLGFMQPFGSLRGQLYGQFTVLTNSPVYHGVLAVIYQVLAKRNITPAQKDFSKKFRQAECLWGLANVAADIRGQRGLLNVSKYQSLLKDRDAISLPDIKERDAIFARLGYGTLGHYSSSSVQWGILDRGGRQLTALGHKLADAFDSRGERSLRDALGRWLNKETFTVDQLALLGKFFNLSEPASHDEAEVWQQALKGWCVRHEEIRALWTKPPSDELRQYRTYERAYTTFFPQLIESYKGFDSLQQTLNLAARFEELSALCLFLFEREYLACVDANMPQPGQLEDELARRLLELADEYIKLPRAPDVRNLFARLAAAGHQGVAQVLVDHHVAHQKAKRTMPYIEGGELRIRDRVDQAAYTALREELCKELDQSRNPVELLTYRYKRDWHFDRAQTYARYMKGAT